MTYAVLSLLFVITVVYAIVSAYKESEETDRRNAWAVGGIKPPELDHAPLLTWRVIILGVLCVFAMIIACWPRWAPVNALVFVGLAGMSWGTFVIIHRLVLNDDRKFHPCYVAPGNNYDRLFLWLAWHHVARVEVGTWQEVHARSYSHGLNYTKAVHRAGRLAYITEATVWLASIALTITQAP